VGLLERRVRLGQERPVEHAEIVLRDADAAGLNRVLVGGRQLRALLGLPHRLVLGPAPPPLLACVLPERRLLGGRVERDIEPLAESCQLHPWRPRRRAREQAGSGAVARSALQHLRGRRVAMQPGQLPDRGRLRPGGVRGGGGVNSLWTRSPTCDAHAVNLPPATRGLTPSG
jgi:hypothetical protein